MLTQSKPNRYITAGLMNPMQVAAELGYGERTILRYEHFGMPAIKIGELRLYDPAAVRAWSPTHEHRHEEPRRGRAATGRAA
jgi:hypothetical protein